MSGAQLITVSEDDSDMRIERWIQIHYPSLPRSVIHKWLRTGQVRVDSKRVKPTNRLVSGQSVRLPPAAFSAPVPQNKETSKDTDREALESMIIYRDDDLFILNKPFGLPVQGGSGLSRHIDGMLPSLQGRSQHKPRLVHRLDRETSGVLIIARRRSAAARLSEKFRERDTEKTYWALVHGVPRPKKGKISHYLAPCQRDGQDLMRVAQHGERGASHALTFYETIETVRSDLAWVSLKPVTGRTHQLRVQLEAIGHPIVGDSKYGNRELFPLPSGLQNRLHLLARRLRFQGPSGQMIDITAPLPPHMIQSWQRFGLDTRERPR